MPYRLFFLFFIVLLSLEAADSNYSGYSYQRYEEYSEYFDGNQNKGERTFWNRKFMTGDWGGARQSMSDQGVVITSSIVSDLLGNPVGGLHRGFRNATSWGADITLDLEKIAKMPGMILYSSIAFRFGNNLSADTIGNQFTVAQVYGGQTFHFCETIDKKTLSTKFALLG
jgi:porin